MFEGLSAQPGNATGRPGDHDERLMQAIEWNSTLPKAGATDLFPSQDGSSQGPAAQGQPLPQNGNDMIG